jgi:hypothetical protein
MRRLELALYPKQGELRGLRLFLTNRLARLRRKIDPSGN